MNTERFTFGGVTLEVRGQDAWTVSKASARFHAEDGAETNHVISVEYSPTPPPVPDHAVKNGPDEPLAAKGRRCIRSGYTVQGSFRMPCARRGKRAFFSAKATGSTMYSQAILESADMFDILAGYGQLVLHSSYVLTQNGKAVLFSGPSGIGKSTQASLWQQYACADVINGDRTLIRTDDLTANGVFYSGTSGICKNVTAPLRAIVLLDKADENTLRRAGAKEAFAAVLSQCSYYQWDAESAIHMTDLVAGLVRRADVYRLSCRADEEAVRLLQNELFGG